MSGRRKDPNTGLTKQQYHFCREFVKTGNKSDAYRAAYSAKGMKPAAVHVESDRLMKRPAVALCIQGMQKEIDTAASKELGLTREWIISRMMKNAEIALGEVEVKQKVYNKTLGCVVEVEGHMRDASAANQALTALGKVDTIGMFVERSKVELSKTFDEMDDDELEAFIAEHTLIT